MFTILLKILFPIVLFAISNDSRIGTPAEFKADKVLEKLANDDFVINSFVNGNFNKSESFQNEMILFFNKILDEKY